jgi:RNA polymerase sigma factor (sigma-70 family)
MISSTEESPHEPSANAFAFEATRWTLLRQANAGGDADKERALEDLCRRYWKPLWKYVSWAFHLNPADAEDAVQGFMESAVRRDLLSQANEERGKFRTFLLTAMRNHCLQRLARAQTLKRGAGAVPVAMTSPAELETLPNEVPSRVEEAVDREWALTTMKASLKMLVEDYEKRGFKARAEAFVNLAVLDQEESHQSLSARLGMPEAQVAVELHRFRRRLREAFLRVVGDTVNSASEAEEEANYLLGLLAWI